MLSIQTQYYRETISFVEQSFKILMKPTLFISSVMDHAFGVLSKKFLSNLRLQRFPFMFPLRSFILIVTGFTFRSVIHFALIFVHHVVYRLTFIYLHLDIQLFQHHLS